MKWVKVLVVAIVFSVPTYAFSGAWEQAQELCKQSGGNCNYNIPTPTLSVDKSHPSKPKVAPKTYTHKTPPSLTPSQSIAVGIFSGLFSGLFSNLLSPPDTSEYDRIQAQKQKEYEQQKKFLMQQKQKALAKWHAIADDNQKQTDNPALFASPSPLGFKTLGSTLQPFKWESKVNPQVLNEPKFNQISSQSVFDFNNEIQIFIENRLDNLIEAGGSNFLEQYHKKNLMLAQSLKENKKLQTLGKFVSEETFENTFGVASILVSYKQGGFIKATQTTADFIVSKIGIPQASFTLEAGRLYSRFGFKLLEKDLTDISNALNTLSSANISSFDFKEFVNQNFNAKQKAVMDWLKGDI